MERTADEHDFEQLFAHQAWVRALALRLCSDGQAADDVEQDTWLAVLRGRGRPNEPRKWLAGVVRHLARRARREDIERIEREAASASASEMPAPETLLAHAELQRKVIAAVAALQEPYRTVVLLRYYEGLEPDAIARRLALPGSTVRNRLARALGQLRERLDREYDGGRGAWSVLLAPMLSIDKLAVG